MKAVILAAGKGARMRPLTRYVPKPLVKVRSRTFLDHIIDSLPSAVREVIVVIGYKGGQIKKYLGSSYKGRRIAYVRQKKLNGTANALLATRPFLRGSERFLVFYGDELPRRREVAKMLTYPYSVLCHKIKKPIPTGVVSMGEHGRILKIVEHREPVKPPVISTGGAMLLGQDIFRHKATRHPNGEFYLSEMLNAFVKKHPVYAVMGLVDTYFISKDDVDRINKE